MLVISWAISTRVSSSASLASRRQAIRSASLMTTARTSSTMASNMRRTLSTCSGEVSLRCRVCRERMASISSTPSTSLAILGPKSSFTFSCLMRPASTKG
ncbi:hypothetical protein D1872_308300 [compost metagenome]